MSISLMSLWNYFPR